MAWVHAYLPAPEAVTVFSVVDALAGIAAAAGDERGVDQRRADAFADVFHAIASTGVLPDGSALPAPKGLRVGVQIAVNATTLLGLDDLPGELAGYGPIPADLARDLATKGTWRAVLTDADGHVLHVADRIHPAGPVVANRSWCGRQGGADLSGDGGSTTSAAPAGVHGEGRYQPSAGLTRMVLARDPVCCFAGCAQPAWRCDLDHEIPYDPTDPGAGATCACNLRPLCRRHHRLKTHAGWTITTDPATGQIATRSPSGQTYLRPRPSLVATEPALDPDRRALRRRRPLVDPDDELRPPSRPTETRPPGRYDGPPPF
jgi:hypothetical protein